MLRSPRSTETHTAASPEHPSGSRRGEAGKASCARAPHSFSATAALGWLAVFLGADLTGSRVGHLLGWGGL